MFYIYTTMQSKPVKFFSLILLNRNAINKVVTMTDPTTRTATADTTTASVIAAVTCAEGPPPEGN